MNRGSEREVIVSQFGCLKLGRCDLAWCEQEPSVPWSDVSVRKMLAYGTLLYVVEQLFSYPADLLRTRLQVAENLLQLP